MDIGCGMLVTKFDTLPLTLEQVDDIVKRNIPMGMNSRQSIVVDFTSELDKAVCKEAFDVRQVNKSIGSLGGGNHFIEIDKDEDGKFYLVIHTGSRNFGKRVAEFYQNKAIDYHSKKGLKSKQDIVNELKSKGLQHLIADELKKRNAIANEALTYLEGDLFDAYLNDMQIAQKMASENRKAIADILCRCMHIKAEEQFETIHNYIEIDKKILRKGAISAKKDEVCLIPINMRDGSLICVGKGNEDYNCSAPHGAGRLMSRKQAKRELSLEGFKDTMKDIYSSTVGESTLDEAPDAYKPIAEILENIQDTVTVLKQIKPIYNVKSEGE